MFSRVYSGALNGVDAYRVEVEVDCSGGMGQINIVGLPDAAVKESQERVRSAIRACKFLMPSAKKWTVNLAPADTKKEGPFLDLPIAVGILASSGHILSERLAGYWIMGELGLDGAVRQVAGVLAVALACKQSGTENLIVPEANAEEASLVDGLNVYPVSNLKQVFQILTNERALSPLKSNARLSFTKELSKSGLYPDFLDVKGQENAKRALMISAAGHHNIMMVGPPGSGKSMLAQRLPGIMPDLDFEEAIELTKLYSVAGKLNEKGSIVSRRPFRAPHHTASQSGLLGGGAFPRPGEITLSHKGILFLDEFTEFSRHLLDSLRQPLESGEVTISRSQNTFTFPAAFLLVSACNPCPCGYRGDPIKYCICTPAQADRYWSKLSGPILDRIDLHVDVSRLNTVELSSDCSGESTETIRMRVKRALDAQKSRFGRENFVYNGQLGQQDIRRFCRINGASKDLLALSVSQMGLSARAYDRIIRVARTIADLEGSHEIERVHVAEALKYRQLKLSRCA